MVRNKENLLFLIFTLLLSSLLGLFFIEKSIGSQHNITIEKSVNEPKNKDNNTLKELEDKKILQTNYHIFQTYNNCGPASLSMALSYFGISESQEKLGNDLRPYQVPSGDNDDKSVTLEEMGKKAEEYNLTSYHRANGNIGMLQQFINNDIPVITRTWLEENDDIGHYRVVKGYDVENGELIQDDSYQGKNLTYDEKDFNKIWKKFNYEYLVLVPEEKKEIAEAILGVNIDKKYAWQRAVELSEKELEKNPEDRDARFNLSVALFHTGNYAQSVEEFEKVENRLSKRTLWYQIEPIESYQRLGEYEKVFQITNNILINENKAFSELYVLRGKIYQKQGKLQEAKSEFEKAVFYNRNFQAKKLLNSLS